MCLESIRDEFLAISHPGNGIYSIFAYKIIQRDLRSMHNHHIWAPGHYFIEHKAKYHPIHRRIYNIDKSFHAYRYLKDAKESIYNLKEEILIKIEISRDDITGANLTQVSARKVTWNGDYLCPKTNRWKKLKINW
jgi:hypothetical protein